MRGGKLPRGWIVLLLLTCFAMPAIAQESTSPAPSNESETMRRSECEQIVNELELEAEAILTQRLREVSRTYEARLTAQELASEAAVKTAAEEGAAAAARPLLVEIAGLTAERNAAIRQARSWAIGLAVGVPAAGILGTLIGWGLRALLHPG